MIEPKINECVYCKRVSIWSRTFKTYVCDDCYALDFAGRMKIVKERKEKEMEEYE